MQVLDGRSGLLGVLRDANFVDVACDHSSGYTYFVTDSGILCIFKEGRVIDKWVNLQVTCDQERKRGKMIHFFIRSRVPFRLLYHPSMSFVLAQKEL